MTVNQMLSLNWLDLQATTKSTGWKAHYYHTQMFRKLWGHLAAESITRQDIEKWVLERKKVRANNTVKHELSLLRRAFNLAYREDFLAVNPMAKVRARVKERARHQVMLPEDEQVMQYVYSNYFPLGDLLWTVEAFAYLSGLRMCEQAWLRVEHIQGDVCEVPEEGKSGTRQVTLCSDCLEIVALWRDIASDVGSQYLFWPHETDRAAIGDRHVKNVWNRARAIASMFLPHLRQLQRRDLRRTFACKLIRGGRTIFEVQLLLGHATTKQTQTYCAAGLDQLREAVAVLNKRIVLPPLPPQLKTLKRANG